ncbi:hypothetical protein OTK49_00135 [Vibrio coralliirubri]|uniref:hypothetical protein n=1 Tax=Vibrio coralliirubri TaxID=1516159 RepID=UPI0022845642|nr:hypothetical protein [Vibrio coralliirubri]MCY9860948.1 hypothetical protein [Vibrio coralliirubri]
MNKINSIKGIVTVMVVGALSQGAIALPTTGSTDDAMMQYYKENEKFACTPEELADFLSERRKSLQVVPNIMTADKFVELKAVESKDKGEDNCLTLFDNLKVMEDIKKLWQLIQDLKMPDFGNDGMGTAAQLLAQELLKAAMESVCNALTKEAAEKLINEIMDRQLGYDIKDIKEFDPKEFAKGVALNHAEDYLESEDIDPDWLDKDNHRDLMSGEISDYKESLVEETFGDD